MIFLFKRMSLSLICEKIDLSSLSIWAAEELQRLRLKENTHLSNTIELSTFIKREFAKRLDYSLIFSNAYFSTYSKRINLGEIKKYSEDISEKLANPLDLKKNEIENLIGFCANLSDYSTLHEEEIRNLKSGPCFS
jgi:hypothetical protein